MTRPNARVHAFFQHGWEPLLDTLFPPRCVNCRRVGQPLCATCLAEIEPIAPPWCERCGQALPFAQTPCPSCAAYSLTITQIRAAGWHQGALRQAIHALKYNRRRDVAKPLGAILEQRLAMMRVTFDYLVPVPLQPQREHARGYNQARLLTEQLAQRVQKPLQEGLTRTRATADQIGLDYNARHANVCEAFQANDPHVSGARLILIDDVCTTGATLDACATALFQGGARAVYGLTVARPHFMT